MHRVAEPAVKSNTHPKRSDGKEENAASHRWDGRGGFSLREVHQLGATNSESAASKSSTICSTVAS